MKNDTARRSLRAKRALLQQVVSVYLLFCFGALHIMSRNVNTLSFFGHFLLCNSIPDCFCSKNAKAFNTADTMTLIFLKGESTVTKSKHRNERMPSK
jgi:hypothetical protein